MALYGTVSPGFPLSLKNLIINGAFDHWQRATSANITGGYGSADRWAFSNSSACTFSRSTFSPGATSPGDNSTYYATINANSNTYSTAGISLRHHIEGVRSIPSGQTFTVSFWFRSSQVTSVGVNCFNFFNSSTSYEIIDTTKYSSTIPLNTWTKLTYTFTQNNLSGKTITTGNDSILIQIQNNSTFSGSNTMDFAEVQVELGSVATNFERRPVGLELALCQRYYYQYSNSGLSDNQYFSSPYVSSPPNSSASVAMYFPVTMRIAPTLSSVMNSGSVNRQTSTTNMGVFQIATSSGSSAYAVTSYTASAELS